MICLSGVSGRKSDFIFVFVLHPGFQSPSRNVLNFSTDQESGSHSWLFLQDKVYISGSDVLLESHSSRTHADISCYVLMSVVYTYGCDVILVTEVQEVGSPFWF